MANLIDRVGRALVAPVDAAGLAFFRIAFGSIIVWEVWRAFDRNLIRNQYDRPTYLFRWWLFDWVRPLPGVLVYVAFAVLGLGAVLLALGLFYRAGAVITCAGMSYWFLLDKSGYLNHRYLAALITFLLIFVPANAAFSIDARRRPGLRSETVPAWSLWLMRFQTGVPYFFAGIAKLGFDWLVRAEPLGAVLYRNTDMPLIGDLFASQSIARLLAWGAAAFDCFVVFLLLYRRTRVLAFAFALAFHFLNSRLFSIGMFPWMMIVATTLFFEPDWPRRMGRSLRSDGIIVRSAVLVGFAIGFTIGGFFPKGFAGVRALTGGIGVAVLVYHVLPGRLRGSSEAARAFAAPPAPSYVLRRPMATLIAVWVTVHMLVPLRHFVIPGNVNWTEEGNRFAWRMLVFEKNLRAEFVISEPSTGRRWVEDRRKHLTPFQISRMRTPDMILQFAHHLKDYYREQGRDVSVYVQSAAILNERPPQWFIYPPKDLGIAPRPYLPPADWLEPLERYEPSDAANLSPRSGTYIE